jgi:hypothetical protein
MYPRPQVDLALFSLCHQQTSQPPNIEYTDFRVLSLQGESYQDLCQRLFGQTLHPQHMCHKSVETEREEQDDAAKYHGWEFLDRFLKYVSAMKWKPESLSIGTNESLGR